MKNILKIFIITTGVVLFLNVNSYALVDVAAWGGYGFNGKVEGASDAEPKGALYGVKGHYNFSIIPMFEGGIGAYYQHSIIKYDVISSEEFKRDSLGLDVNLILSLPIIHPYVRGTFAVVDKLEDDKENFKAYGVGAGIELTFIPFFRIFGEYMYDHTDHDGYLNMNNINVGLKFDF